LQEQDQDHNFTSLTDH